MSEYWVSKKKYWCQYCEIFITDDAPSRAQHENGLRHKGNKDRFIRSLYKTSIKKKQDGEEEKREMKRVEEAARAAYAQDVGSGLGMSMASASSSSAAPAPTPRPKPPPKPSDPYVNYTTAASLGISDPEVDRYIIEAAARKTEGRAGEWTAVAPPPPPPPLHQESTAHGLLSDMELKLDPGENVGQIRKRDKDALADEDDTRQFKIQKKSVAVGLGEIYDPGVIQIKPKTVKQEISADGNSETTVDGIPSAMEKPKWVSRGWRRAGEPTGEDASPFTRPENVKPNVDTSPKEQVTIGENAIDDNVKLEIKQEWVNEVKKEESTDLLIPPTGSSTADLFRKRKVPTASRSSVGHRKGR